MAPYSHRCKNSMRITNGNQLPLLARRRPPATSALRSPVRGKVDSLCSARVVPGVTQSGSFLSSQELQKQAADLLRLLLLNPMSRTINQMRAAPLSADGGSFHFLKYTGGL